MIKKEKIIIKSCLLNAYIIIGESTNKQANKYITSVSAKYENKQSRAKRVGRKGEALCIDQGRPHRKSLLSGK